MYKTRFFCCLFLLSLLVNFFACDDNYDDYSTNPNNLLTFSKDTVRFDTVLTTINSPVKYLMVYNRYDKPLLISSVELEQGENSQFKINVDGMAGKDFQDVAIRPNDSLYVMIDVKPEENGEITPTLFDDHIVFVTNGVSQKIVLEAYGQDVFIWKEKVISSDTTIRNSKPILICDSLVIEENVTLSVEEGICFYMDNNAKIVVNGNVKFKGSLEKPIVFRGKRTDSMLSISYDLIPGQWDGFYFSENSFSNEMEYVQIRNGMSGLYFDISTPDEEKIRMENVVLTNFSEFLIRATNCNITAGNCEFSNSRFALLYLVGGKYSFTHCTMANFMLSSPESGWATSNNETLILSNTDILFSGKPIHYPLLQADFTNTIIWGKSPGWNSDIWMEAEEGMEFNYFFRNCIIPNKGENGEHTVDCIFNKDPLFRKVNLWDPETKKYSSIDLRLKTPEEGQDPSPAINAADPDYSISFPFDLDGNDRFADEKPDMGAYEL
ncbi:hypothetical protein LJC52_00190 [Bacteroidales bacterium OttesenSCG-928-A17]|nr:hypothetical protein [Bacteroidales bacterium OttesenSCG-928-A17]